MFVVHRRQLIVWSIITVRAPPQTWTVLQQDGPNHLGLWCDALPEHQTALITSGLRALQFMMCMTVFGAAWAEGLSKVRVRAANTDRRPDERP